MRKHKLSSPSVPDVDNTDFSRWLSGIPYEISFWSSYYGNERRFRDLMRWSKLGEELELDGFDVASYLHGLTHEPVIADVGCALSYMLGNKIGEREFQITYIDPLAVHYNRILKRTKRSLPPITFGMGETLALHFEPSSADLIHIRNSLDHSAFPMLSIWQALISLRVGGILYLNHKPNEAVAEGYRGFHQYNIDCEDGKMILWNKEARLDVAEILGEYAEVSAEKTEDGRIVNVIRKLKEIPSNHPAIKDGKRFYTRFTQEALTYFHSLPKGLNYQWARIYTSIGHRIMRLIPYSLLNKIKKIAAPTPKGA